MQNLINTITKFDSKNNILDIADNLGQKEQLIKLFNFAPYSLANYWAVVDFNKSSNIPRLFIFNLRENSCRLFLVAHGKNSGEEFATFFGNDIGSNKSSLGIYMTLGTYIGGHGNSLKVSGLESSNNNAYNRYVVIHKADYVVPNYRDQARAGRSEGCFAVHPSNIDEVISCLKEGSYLIAWHN